MEVQDNVVFDVENRGDEVDRFIEFNNKCDELDIFMFFVFIDSEVFSIFEVFLMDDLEDLIYFLGDVLLFLVDVLKIIDEWENRYFSFKIVNDVEQCKVNLRFLSDIKCFDIGISDSVRENVIINDDFSKSRDVDENYSSDEEKR